ncbi:MAG: TetR/AcrR family transcriptional regulator [Notoacmeibacter sp.]|nr:TetR/AcrR family transcriptional regulator [Notoacmeibacter sp.]MCC0032111.1 TetR/AcrR family transcriptional regulator [Brucellaceae bacterium]
MAPREDRRRQILAVVLDILREGGASAVTTARIAARARCSKETLYNWFGDRDGIFRALVEAQSAQLNAMMARELAENADNTTVMVRAGAALLDLLTGEASLAINRSAMADGSGELGELLLQHGRGRTAPQMAGLITRLQADGKMGDGDPAEIFQSFYGLLIGDRQVRALLGDKTGRPRPGEFETLSRLAFDRTRKLFPAVAGATRPAAVSAA